MSAALVASPSSQSDRLTSSAAALPTQRAVPAVTLDSDALLRGHKSVEIIHHGTAYRLQATKLGKLILTK